MVFEHRAVFDRPTGEVFAWHARPGALERLLPPWQPARVRSESPSLSSGEAVIDLPGPLVWRARHLPEGYEEGRRFTDVLATPGLDRLVSWRHTHLFSEEPGGRTLLTDRVETRVPGRFLRSMFAYRTRQLGGDLEAHERWSGPSGRQLTVAVTGSSGTIGSALCAFLSTGGHRVVRLVRRGAAAGERLWNPEDPAPDLLEGVDAVVHLAGASIAGRFTEEHKRAVRDSRVGPTRRLAEAAARAGVAVFASASAIGFYGADRGDEELTEESSQGDDFLAEVVAGWEADTRAAAEGGAKVVNVRTGIVQTPRGGALRLLRPLFEAGLGGPLGGGSPWTAWIGIDDLLDVYLRALRDPALSGPVNATAPRPVRNAEYTRTLARVLRRPAVLPVPGFGPRLLLGREGAEQVALASQRVLPARLLSLGHPFRHPELEPALRHLLGRSTG
jgi:uncharacterized protein (TIGR01777 family)